MTKNLQDTYAPTSICFGCGPANAKGLRIKSIPQGDDVVATFMPEEHHQAFPGMINGGIIGALLDCHSNWTAAHHLMRTRGLDAPPCTVTAEFNVKLRRPTPTGKPLHLKARPTATDGDKVTVEATLEADGKVCATCTGVFVAVKEGHPAYHRW
ncbi:MAG: PaaI family thioesterase [Myxococcota bacterium]